MRGDDRPSTTESVMGLLDRLEALLLRSAGLPPPKGQAIDAREVADVLHMIRAALPSELRDAHRLLVEAEQFHRAAADEARRIVLDAQATARRLSDHSPVLKDAERSSHDLLARAEQDAQHVREGADMYASQVLGTLEESVLRILDAIRRGQQFLKESRK